MYVTITAVGVLALSVILTTRNDKKIGVKYKLKKKKTNERTNIMGIKRRSFKIRYEVRETRSINLNILRSISIHKVRSLRPVRDLRI